MGELTNAEAALLGLLSEKPMYPYQIEQEIKYRDMRFWTELSMSSIYKLLRKLEKDDLVERKNEISSENRLRKLYTIRNKGKEVLDSKLEAILSIPEHTRWRIDIAIYNCDLLPSEIVKEALKKYRVELQKTIKGYKELKKFLTDSDCPAYRFAVAERPVFLLKAEIEWVDSYLEQVIKSAQGDKSI